MVSIYQQFPDPFFSNSSEMSHTSTSISGIVRCVAMGDAYFPVDFARGDARFNTIYMTDPKISLYGYGPSVVDFRSGEIMNATVLLGFSPFTQV